MKATYIDEWNKTLQFCCDEGYSLGSVNSMYLVTENIVALYIRRDSEQTEIIVTDHILDRSKPWQQLLEEFNAIRDTYLAARVSDETP